MESKRETDGKSEKDMEKGRGETSQRDLESCIIIRKRFGIQCKSECGWAFYEFKIGQTQGWMKDG